MEVGLARTSLGAVMVVVVALKIIVVTVWVTVSLKLVVPGRSVGVTVMVPSGMVKHPQALDRREGSMLVERMKSGVEIDLDVVVSAPRFSKSIDVFVAKKV